MRRHVGLSAVHALHADRIRLQTPEEAVDLPLDPEWDDPAALPRLVEREASRVISPLTEPQWQALFGQSAQAP